MSAKRRAPIRFHAVCQNVSSNMRHFPASHRRAAARSLHRCPGHDRAILTRRGRECKGLDERVAAPVLRDREARPPRARAKSACRNCSALHCKTAIPASRGADCRVRWLRGRDRSIALLYGRVSGAGSLREIVGGLRGQGPCDRRCRRRAAALCLGHGGEGDAGRRTSRSAISSASAKMPRASRSSSPRSPSPASCAPTSCNESAPTASSDPIPRPPNATNKPQYNGP